MAGFPVAASRGLAPIEAARLAAACGTANCLADTPGLIAINQVTQIMPLVAVN
jgi:fructose-1-phosphate kinase PfkB-like protein